MAQVLGDVLPDSPSDGISAIQFSTHSNLLVAASWDKTVRLYDAAASQHMATVTQATPVLDVAFPDDNTVYSGALDGTVNCIDIPSGHVQQIGRHEAAVRTVRFLPSRGLLVSGSWDQGMKVWDPRSPTPLIKAIGLPGKVYAMSATQDWLVVGTSGRHVLIFDVRKLEFGMPEQQRESSLKYQTRCIACGTDQQGYALGSVEGRVAMEVIDPSSEAQAGKYAFKCHRRTEEGKGEVVYPVHAIAYQPKYGTFATGGGDGVVNIWDGGNKKRLFQISRYPTSVSALSFSKDGQYLAVAASYTYEQGEPTGPTTDSIYIRQLADAEVRPKAKAPA